jgi:glycosyltransferase involved in cell wall biosynthesis
MQQLSDNILQPNHNQASLGKPSLLVFELAHSGHYAAYIQHLIKYWCEQNLEGKLHFVVSQTFASKYPELLNFAHSYGKNNLMFTTITKEEEAKLIPKKSSIYRAARCLQEWKLVRKYAKICKSTHCILLYFDSFQIAVALGLKLPCTFSGIYFRPSFHYPSLNNYIPTFPERVQYWREKLILPKVIRHPQLENLFCLDPFAITSISAISQRNKAVYLPDPVKIHDGSVSNKLEPFRQKLGIAPGRKVFLLFGSLYDSRKGINQLLTAISSLPPVLCQQISLLLVGEITQGQESPLMNQIAEVSESLPVQIIIQDKYIPEEEVPLYFQTADVVLAPYQRHVGMSGIIVQAAAAQKPLLSSNYGLMGKTVRHWELGLTVDSTEASEIAKGLTRFLLESPEKLGDRNKMKAFALQNSAENFAALIFKRIGNL